LLSKNDNKNIMNKNTLLNIANFLCQFYKVLIAMVIIITTAIFIHFQFDRDSYNEWKIEQPESDSPIRYETTNLVGENPIGDQKLKLSDWRIASLYFSYLKFIAILILNYLIITQFGRVLKSVRKLKTFHQTNVEAFRKIGYYCLLITGLSTFNYWAFNDYTKSSFSISINILLLSLIAFILAEIFKEGNNLMEENKLTI